MKTRTLLTSQNDSIDQALSVLHNGGLVAFPTDTVYGLGCLAFDAAGIELIYQAKGRDSAKAIPILIGDLEQFSQIALELTPSAGKLAARFWPGALTLVVPKHPNLPENLSQTPTVGVRMPDMAYTLALLRRSGPLAVTSANLSGKDNPKTALDVLEQLDGRIDLVLDGGATPGGVPSTVVDCTARQARILRLGAITAAQIEGVIGEF